MSNQELIVAKQRREAVTKKMNSINFNEPHASKYRLFLLDRLYACLEQQLDTIDETIARLEISWGNDGDLP